MAKTNKIAFVESVEGACSESRRYYDASDWLRPTTNEISNAEDFAWSCSLLFALMVFVRESGVPDLMTYIAYLVTARNHGELIWMIQHKKDFHNQKSLKRLFDGLPTGSQNS